MWQLSYYPSHRANGNTAGHFLIEVKHPPAPVPYRTTPYILAKPHLLILA
jgi:hypothetical protein